MNVFGSCAFEDQRLLSVLYAQEHRAYHNAAHAQHVGEYCRSIWDRYPTNNTYPKEFFNIAAAFHDAIYELTEAGNEERSAILFERSETRDSRYCSYHSLSIAIAIRCSSNHLEPSHDQYSENIKIFLDADLYELGSEWELFDHNSKNLETEYRSVYTEVEFLQGRKAWLETMLAKDKIYWVVKDRDRKAFRNLQRCLDSLNTRLERGYGLK